MVETGSLWDSSGTKQLRHKYDENGTLRDSGNFDVNGTLRLTNIFDENGTLSEDRVYFGNGITVRRQNTFAEDGTLTSSHYFDKNGERNLHKEGLILASDVRVKIVRLNLYPNPTEDSVPKLYDRHELDREIPGDASTYAFAINGTVVEFYDNEYKIKKRQEEIKDGLYDGTSIWWYSNGKKQFEAEFVGGVPQGTTKWYHMNGSVEYEGEWQDNKLVRATTWTDSDQQNGQVLDGNGELIYLHPNGEKRLWEKYEMGKLTVTKWWDENGNPVESAETKFIPYYRRRIK
jgi:antitoxin component YwqK of YwqJK toxin-antitoxin module